MLRPYIQVDMEALDLYHQAILTSVAPHLRHIDQLQFAQSVETLVQDTRGAFHPHAAGQLSSLAARLVELASPPLENS